MWTALLQLSFLLVSQGSKVSAVNPCTEPKAPGGVWQEGCLVKTCNSGNVEETLAEECVKLIEKKVEKILGEKLAEKGIECSSGLTEAGKYQTPGIILAGGSWQNQVKLIKPDTKEVCNLPDIPDYFSWSSMDLVDGTPVMCGSWFGSPGDSRMKNETEKRSFFCCQFLRATFPSNKRSRVDDLCRRHGLEKRPRQSGHSGRYSSHGRLQQEKR